MKSLAPCNLFYKPLMIHQYSKKFEAVTNSITVIYRERERHGTYCILNNFNTNAFIYLQKCMYIEK